MKKLFCLLTAALMVLTISCKKDGKPGKGKYGVDGVTPMPEAVDLGMVVEGKTVLWASFNLGASKECGYGDFYAWGETGTKENYSWATYKFGSSPSGPFTKYGAEDGKVAFSDYDYVDDAARTKLGGAWRIPTNEEWKALRENCTWTWSDDYNDTGVKGIIITSKIEGHEDKSIFLPAAGRSSGTSGDKQGFYWASSRRASNPGNASSTFYMYPLSIELDYGVQRFYGLSIRPVYVE